MLKLDTLSYKYVIKADRTEFFNTLMALQLDYFKQNDPRIQQLDEGTSISCQLPTKVQKLDVQSQITVKKIASNQAFVLETLSSSGTIRQSFLFSQDKKGRDILTYSEENHYNQARSQYSFMLVGFLYQFFYNRQMAKRMERVDQIALSNS